MQSPTRFRNSQSPSLLDLILVNDSELVPSFQHQSPLGKSHHVVLHSVLYLNFLHVCKKSSKTLKITDYSLLNREVGMIDRSSIFAPEADVESM